MSEDERGVDPGDVFRRLKHRPTPGLDGERLWRRVEAGIAAGRARRGASSALAARSRRAAESPAAARTPALVWGVAAMVVLMLGLWSGLFWSLTLSPGPDGETRSGPEVAGPDGETRGGPEVAGPDGETRGGPEVAGPDVEASPESPGATGRLVMLGSADGEPGATAAIERLPEMLNLRVRLIRGYDGEPPADVEQPALGGAGGADELADIRPQIAGLLDYEGYGLTGRWQGTLQQGLQQGVELGPDTTMRIASIALAPEGEPVSVELVDLLLRVDGTELSTPRLRLVPGRVYLLGLPDEGESRRPSRVLAVRADLPDAPRRP